MFSLMDLASSWAKEARRVRRSSPLPSMVEMCSFSNWTSTFRSLRRRMEFKRSTVFLAKRWMDLVRIRSISPLSAFSIMAMKPSRRLVLVPVMPSSVKMPAKVQAGLFFISPAK